MAMKFDFKKALVDHAEKIVFGVIVLVVLLSLAQTQWKPYEGTPSQIVKKVEEGEKRLYSHTWPDEEREQYELTQEDTPAQIVHNALYKPIDVAQYEMSNKLYRSPFAGQDPLREPVLVRPLEPLASAGRVFIEQRELVPEGDEASSGDATLADAEPEEVDESIPDEFRKRKTNTVGLGSGGGEFGADPYAEYIAPELEDYGDSGAYTDPSMYAEGLGGGLDGMAMQTGPKKMGQGFHFASVRAVFPLREQIRKYAEAIHSSYHEAARVFQIIDFELERQTRQPGDDPWSGPWQPVDIRVAKDVLEKAAGFEPDVVNSVVTDSVITMPLPMRISGAWRRQATHPKIEKFELSDAEIEKEVELNRRLLETAIEQRKAFSETTVQRGGFADLQFDSREIQANLLGSESAFDMDYMQMPGGRGGAGGRGARQRGPQTGIDALIDTMLEKSENRKEQEKVLRQWIQERVSVEGELILFRYLDFSVEPGKTYRYRVRLVLANPNYGRHVAEAGGLQHVVEGPTRKTEWSDPTGQVTVASDINYFLADVHSSRARLLPTARLDTFQWDSRYGTTMNDILEIRPGQKIADKVETEVIDPAAPKFEKEKYEFRSDDFVVDVLEDIEFDSKLHTSEGPAATRLKMMPGANNAFQVDGRVLVGLDAAGVDVLEGASPNAARDRLKKYQGYQSEQFAYLKEAAKAAEQVAGLGELGSEFGELYGGAADPGSMMMPGGGRTRNALRKSSRRSVRGGRSGGGGGSSSSMGAP